MNTRAELPDSPLVEELLELLEALHGDAQGRPPSEVLDLVLDRIPYRQWLQAQKDGQTRAKHIANLRAVIQSSAARDVGTWLVDMQLGDFDGPADAGAKSVTLTTIHGGKGAEWPVVILVGCEDGLFLGGDTIVESSAKYLGLPGPKPMLGWGNVRHNTRSVSVVEGPLDLLALGMWGVPGIALARSYASEHNLHLLERFDRLYLALDQDDGGRSATWELASRFGPRAVPVALPPGVKDPADLARLIDGEQLFRSALRAADDAYRLVA